MKFELLYFIWFLKKLFPNSKLSAIYDYFMSSNFLSHIFLKLFNSIFEKYAKIAQRMKYHIEIKTNIYKILHVMRNKLCHYNILHWNKRIKSTIQNIKDQINPNKIPI